MKIKIINELAPAPAPAPTGTQAGAPPPNQTSVQTPTQAPATISPNTAKTVTMALATSPELALQSINFKNAAVQAAIIKVLSSIKIVP